MKISPGWLKQNIFFRGFHWKCHFQNAFDDNLSVTHVFIKQIFRAVELVPHFPLPFTGLCRGWGSSGSFHPQAVALVMAIKQWGLGLKKSFVCDSVLLCKSVWNTRQNFLANPARTYAAHAQRRVLAYRGVKYVRISMWIHYHTQK
jgi:hypothetical protein